MLGHPLNRRLNGRLQPCRVTCTPLNSAFAARTIAKQRAAVARAASLDVQRLEGDVYIPTDAAGVAERRRFVLEDTTRFLESDLRKLFTTGEITVNRYSQNIKFEDPISSFNDLNGYLLNLRLLKTFFDIEWDLHSIQATRADEVTARWTMKMTFWLAPWKPDLTFTGTTKYKIDPDSGTILQHTDSWDALQHNAFISLEGVQHVLKMFLDVQVTPSIETPKYKVLKKVKQYEVRLYNGFLMAEVSMGPGSGPASGVGFNDLAGYIFGGNSQQMKMEMTTPVITTVAPGQHPATMGFVMEGHFKDVAQLPEPLDKRIVRRDAAPGIFAAVKFGGFPLEYEAVQNERDLRDALIRDGYRIKPGYKLLRYNEPTVPPFLRRNEVLIELESFSWRDAK